MTNTTVVSILVKTGLYPLVSAPRTFRGDFNKNDFAFRFGDFLIYEQFVVAHDSLKQLKLIS